MESIIIVLDEEGRFVAAFDNKESLDLYMNNRFEKDWHLYSIEECNLNPKY